MGQEDAIVIKNVGKKFKVFLDKGQSFKERMLFKNRCKYEERNVLKDISFTVKKGEAVGLVGHNGCGKSTLLKLMTRILYPDKGSIEMKGRVSSLIELGAGFHPDMSGRENIYTNASIFGLTKKEIDARLEDIIKFSELEAFIDNPVRTYSSGMYMRLAFSVAINVDADILLIDEILAVGDTNFQAKCFNRLKEIKKQGTTIVIVSHSLGQIEQICDHSIWIDGGLIREYGSPYDVHPMYLEYMGSHLNFGGSTSEKKSDNRWGSMAAEVSSVQMLDKDGNEQTSFVVGAPVKIRVTYELKENVPDAVFGIGIFRADGVHCYGTNTRIDKMPDFEITKNGCFEVDIEKLNLLPSEYILDVSIETGDGIPVDFYKNAKRFITYSPVSDIGVLRLDHKWETNC